VKFIKLLPIVFVLLSANDEVKDSKHIVFSQETNTKCNITFDQIVKEGLGTHPSIAMSKELIEGAKYQVDSAKWGYYPTPTIDVSVKSSNRKQTVTRIDQPLWTGGKLDAAYDKAEAEKTEALHTYDENQYKLIDDYLTTLKNYLQAQKKIEVLNANKKQFNSLMEMLERMMTAGVLSQSDKNLLNSRVSSIYSDLVIAKAKLRVAKIQLEILTGKQIDCNIEFKYKQILSKTLNIQKMIDELIEFHPTVKVMNAKILAAQSEVKTSKSKLWPSLILRAEHKEGTIYDENEPETENLVYLTFNVSTGAGVSALSNISKSKINVSKIRFEKTTKERELIDLLMNDYTNYIASKSQQELIQKNIETTFKIYESNKRLFLSQDKKWLDVVSSLSELNRQKIENSKLLVESKILEYKLSLKTGKISLKTGDILSDI